MTIFEEQAVGSGVVEMTIVFWSFFSRYGYSMSWRLLASVSQPDRCCVVTARFSNLLETQRQIYGS